MEDAGLAAEVLRELQAAGIGYLAAKFDELGRYGATKSINRLLRIPPNH